MDGARLSTWSAVRASRREGNNWHKATVGHILHNLTYMGVLRSVESQSDVFSELQIIDRIKPVRKDEIVSRTQMNVTADLKNQFTAAKRESAKVAKEYKAVKSKLMAIIRSESSLPEIFDSNDMTVKKMIAPDTQSKRSVSTPATGFTSSSTSTLHGSI